MMVTNTARSAVKQMVPRLAGSLHNLLQLLQLPTGHAREASMVYKIPRGGSVSSVQVWHLLLTHSVQLNMYCRLT